MADKRYIGLALVAVVVVVAIAAASRVCDVGFAWGVPPTADVEHVDVQFVDGPARGHGETQAEDLDKVRTLESSVAATIACVIKSKFSIIGRNLMVVCTGAHGTHRQFVEGSMHSIPSSEVSIGSSIYLTLASDEEAVSTERVLWNGQATVTLVVAEEWPATIRLVDADGKPIDGFAYVGVSAGAVGCVPVTEAVNVPATGLQFMLHPDAVDTVVVLFADGKVPSRSVIGDLLGRPLRRLAYTQTLNDGQVLLGRAHSGHEPRSGVHLRIKSLHGDGADGLVSMGADYNMCNGGVWCNAVTSEDGAFRVAGIGPDVAALEVSADGFDVGPRGTTLIMWPPPALTVDLELRPRTGR